MNAGWTEECPHCHFHHSVGLGCKDYLVEFLHIDPDLTVALMKMMWKMQPIVEEMAEFSRRKEADDTASN